MRALLYDEFGPPDVLHVGEAPEPHAGPGQIRIAVRAVAVNPWDWKVRRGGAMEVEFPYIPGNDVAGVVDEVGDGAATAIGDEVFGSAVRAGAAEFAVLAAFARKPADLSFEEAAGYVTASEAAVRALDTVKVTRGTTVVIAGAAGGVGSAAVQFAVAEGARVIGTASEGNHEYLRSLGAEPTTYGDGLVERVRALAPDGVDLAFDTAGHGDVPELIALAGDPARVATIADFGAAALGVKVTGGGDGRAAEALDEAVELVDAGHLHVTVAQTFPFAAAAQAHRASQGGHVRGKLVLVPD
jgi:NADPH:quinone reductase-like Zn-dependent oxidoreductase